MLHLSAFPSATFSEFKSCFLGVHIGVVYTRWCAGDHDIHCIASYVCADSTEDGVCSIQLLPLISSFYHHIHFLIVETAQPSDCSTLNRRSSVKPHDVLVGLATNNYIIVLSLTLVWTLCCRLAGS